VLLIHLFQEHLLRVFVRDISNLQRDG
jgi:hypothetical protein